MMARLHSRITLSQLAWQLSILTLLNIIILVVSAPAMAHHPTGGKLPVGFFASFMSGLGHPIIGFDHFAFVVAVGLLSATKRQGILLPIAFVVAAMAGTGLHSMHHTFGWNLNAISFLLPTHQLAIGMGAIAVALLTPAAFTSFNSLQKALGNRWRQIHLLSVPALLLCTIHALLIGSHYLGGLAETWKNQLSAVILAMLTLGVLLVRSRWFWSLLSLEKFYATPLRYK
jgi:DMSO/TMAO reductase YedYZ heme-binding membrane subunit